MRQRLHIITMVGIAGFVASGGRVEGGQDAATALALRHPDGATARDSAAAKV